MEICLVWTCKKKISKLEYDSSFVNSRISKYRKGKRRGILIIKLFAVVLLSFCIANLVFFLAAPAKYNLSLRSLRKALYTLFFGCVSAGFLLDELIPGDWVLLLTLAGIVVFLDIAVLLTPSIMKIWNAEFQYSDYVENVINKNEKIHEGTMRRVGTMSEMIQNAGNYFDNVLPPESEEEEKQQLQNYLSKYSSTYGFSFQLWELEADPASEEYEFTEAVYSALSRIETLNSFTYGSELDAYAASLSQSEIISLIKEDSMIVPVYMEQRSIFVVLKNEKGTLLEVDAVHITNLIYLYYSFV